MSNDTWRALLHVDLFNMRDRRFTNLQMVLTEKEMYE